MIEFVVENKHHLKKSNFLTFLKEPRDKSIDFHKLTHYLNEVFNLTSKSITRLVQFSKPIGTGKRIYIATNKNRLDPLLH